MNFKKFLVAILCMATIASTTAVSVSAAYELGAVDDWSITKTKSPRMFVMDGVGVKAKKTANVRSGPSPSTKLITTVSAGQNGYMTGKEGMDENGYQWIQIQFLDKNWNNTHRGYVREDYLTITSAPYSQTDLLVIS